jgi:uncharacterized membrane protein (Fun14 family)
VKFIRPASEPSKSIQPLRSGTRGKRPEGFERWQAEIYEAEVKACKMKARIKTAILIVYGFSLVMLAYKGAVDIAQDLLGDWLNEEALDAFVGLPVLALMMMELIGVGPIARDRQRQARDERPAQ